MTPSIPGANIPTPALPLIAAALTPLLLWPAAAAAQLSCGGTVGPGAPIQLDTDIGPCPAPGPALTVIGPVVRDGVIAYDEIASAADLPHGWQD